MKKVKLESLYLTNFKAHKDTKINFAEVTTISGRNGVGKSTIFDAFTWLLFGKDQFDRKDSEIIPIIDGKRLEKVDSDVCARLSVDGIGVEIRRVLHQKWVRKRGTADETYEGNETLYYINGVPKKAGEFKAEIDSIIEESVFKLITNPAHFLELHWEKQRQILFTIAGSVSDTEISSLKPEFAKLLSDLSGKPFADFKKELSARKKKLKDDLELIPSRIDQTQKLMPENADFAAIKQQLETIDAQIVTIDKQLENRSEAIREQYEKIQEKQAEINQLKLDQQNIINEKRLENQKLNSEEIKKREDINNKISELENTIRLTEKQRNDIFEDVKRFENAKADLEQRIQKLRQDWDEENAKEFKFYEDTLICPLYNSPCSDPKAQQKYAESKEAAKCLFNEQKIKTLNRINEEGQALKERVENATKLINEKKEEAENLYKKINETITSIQNHKRQIDSLLILGEEVIIESLIPAWVEKDAKIKALEAEINAFEPANNEDLISHKRELNATRDTLNKDIAKEATIEAYKAEIKRLNETAADLAQQIADLEKQEFTMYNFEKIRIEETEKRVNRMFQIVKFKMFDYTNEGNEFPCCIATNHKGIPITNTNTAEQVNAGLDIINTLCEFNNVSAPIFVDRCESVNDLIPTKGQIISLIVNREPLLINNL